MLYTKHLVGNTKDRNSDYKLVGKSNKHIKDCDKSYAGNEQFAWKGNNRANG